MILDDFHSAEVQKQVTRIVGPEHETALLSLLERQNPCVGTIVGEKIAKDQNGEG